MAEDGNIIRFPGAAFALTGRATIEPAAKLVVGPMSFFCTGCGQTCHADFKKMIFRSIEFYCNDCGSLFKVTNPAFTTPPKSKR